MIFIIQVNPWILISFTYFKLNIFNQLQHHINPTPPLKTPRAFLFFEFHGSRIRLGNQNAQRRFLKEFLAMLFCELELKKNFLLHLLTHLVDLKKSKFLWRTFAHCMLHNIDLKGRKEILILYIKRQDWRPPDFNYISTWHVRIVISFS